MGWVGWVDSGGMGRDGMGRDGMGLDWIGLDWIGWDEPCWDGLGLVVGVPTPWRIPPPGASPALHRSKVVSRSSFQSAA